MATLAALAFATLARAQWGAEWPSETHPLRGMGQSTQALQGASERALACGAAVRTSQWWVVVGRQRSKLTDTKTMLADAVDTKLWINPTNYVGGTLDAVLAAGAHPTTLVWQSRAQLLAAVGAPTNWFDATPWIDLAAHSNGWRWVPALCSNLVLTLHEGVSALHGGFAATNSFSDVGTATWPDALGSVNANWPQGGTPLSARAQTFAYGIYNAGYYAAWAGRYASRCWSGSGTVSNSVDLYVKATHIDDIGDVIIFDPQGDGVTTNWTRFANDVGGAVSFGVVTQIVGSCAVLPPNWTAPGTASSNDIVVTGWAMDEAWGKGYFWVRDYRVTGGFRY